MVRVIELALRVAPPQSQAVHTNGACMHICVLLHLNPYFTETSWSSVDRQLCNCFVLQDHEEMSAMDVADAIADMHARGRYRKLFLMVETCQASTMFAHVKSPNVFMLAASKKGVYSLPHLHEFSAVPSSVD